MAALPRKWVSGGAPTLPCIDERAVAHLLWRKLRERWGALRFGSQRQPLQSRAAARNRWRVDLRLDPFFSREAASQGSMAVSAVQAKGVVWKSMRWRREYLSRSRRPCSPLARGSGIRKPGQRSGCLRLLLREAMEGSETPDEFAAIDRDDAPVGERLVQSGDRP